MTDHATLLKATKFVYEVNASTPKQFAQCFAEQCSLADAITWFENASDADLKHASISQYNADPVFKNKDYRALMQPFWELDNRRIPVEKHFALPTVYVNNADESVKKAFITILTVVTIKGEKKYFLTSVLSTFAKYKCVGGPLNNGFHAQVDIGNDYCMYNANTNTGRGARFNRPSALFIHKSLIGG